MLGAVELDVGRSLRDSMGCTLLKEVMAKSHQGPRLPWSVNRLCTEGMVRSYYREVFFATLHTGFHKTVECAFWLFVGMIAVPCSNSRRPFYLARYATLQIVSNYACCFISCMGMMRPAWGRSMCDRAIRDFF